MQNKYRIRKADSLNWVSERYEPGGEINTRGRGTGMPKKERWIIEGHFSSLKNTAKGLLDILIADELGDNAASGKQILAAIEAAEKRIEALVKPEEK